MLLTGKQTNNTENIAFFLRSEKRKHFFDIVSVQSKKTCEVPLIVNST